MNGAIAVVAVLPYRLLQSVWELLIPRGICVFESFAVHYWEVLEPEKYLWIE